MVRITRHPTKKTPCRALQVQIVVLEGSRAGRRRAQVQARHLPWPRVAVHLELAVFDSTMSHEGDLVLTPGQEGQLEPQHAPACRQRRRRPAKFARAEGGDSAAQARYRAASKHCSHMARYHASKRARAAIIPPSTAVPAAERG